MQRLWSTLVLLVLLMALGTYIYFWELKRPSPSQILASRSTALAIAAGTIEGFTIKSESGDLTTLAKLGETWRITSPIVADADGTTLSGLTRAVSSLQVERVVEEAPSDLKQYGLDPPRVEVVVTAAGDQNAKRLLIGDKTATGDDMYAKLASEGRVFLIVASADSAFNRSTWDLRDKTVLRLDRVNIDSLEILSTQHRVRLAKRDLEWAMTRPLQTEADFGLVSELLTKLGTAQMLSLVTQQSTDMARYGLAKPVYSVTVGAGGSHATLHVGSAASASTIYARDLSRPGVFTIERSLLAELEKEPWEFRRKDLFAFHTLTALRLELSRDGRTAIYERAKEQETDTQQKWRELSLPHARNVDPSKIETALSRLSLLRAVSFVDRKRSTGQGSSSISVLVTYEDSEQRLQEERVTIGTIGAEPIAARAEWSDAAKLDPNMYKLLIQALDGLRE
jgi:Domain of unknown function (DUF4340)